MFELDPNPVFIRTVKVRTPHGRSTKNEDFEATFRALPIDKFTAFDTASEAGARELLEATFVLAEGITSDGAPMPDSPALRQALINLPHVRQGLIRAYITGFEEAARGN